MSDFWTWGNYASWENCIEINKICNLKNCPETMNCCVSNCMGMPTIKGVVLILSITIIVMCFIWIFNNVRVVNKISKKNKMLKVRYIVALKGLFLIFNFPL